MCAWLADNPQDKFGKHEYRLAEYGIDIRTAEAVPVDRVRLMLVPGRGP